MSSPASVCPVCSCLVLRISVHPLHLQSSLQHLSEGRLVLTTSLRLCLSRDGFLSFVAGGHLCGCPGWQPFSFRALPASPRWPPASIASVENSAGSLWVPWWFPVILWPLSNLFFPAILESFIISVPEEIVWGWNLGGVGAL